MDIIGWTFPQISEAIMNDAPGIDAAIKRRNAAFCIEIARREAAMNHTAKECHIKNCTHGSEEVIQGAIEHAAVLVAEAQELE